MIRILWVAATEAESIPVRKQLAFSAASRRIMSVTWQDCQIDLLHTGIGMVNTAFSLGKYLANNRPDLALQFGIGGSFDRSIPLGSVVEVIEDTFSELGAEDHDQFLGLEEMGFPNLTLQEDHIYYNTLPNPSPSSLAVKKATAITVNTVHGAAASISRVTHTWGKQIESMEGAAFFHAMLAEGIPFAALRGISNYVEPRNRASWQIGPAVKNVNAAAIEWLKTVSNKS